MEIKNDGRLKICWMRIVGYQQFQDVFLDFTHPETGEPLDKICLIGANGTGKTVVLEMLAGLIGDYKAGYRFWETDASTWLLLKFRLGSRSFLLVQHEQPFYYEFLEANDQLIRSAKTDSLENKLQALVSHGAKAQGYTISYFQGFFVKPSSKNTLLAFAPSESASNSYLEIQDVPKTSLDQARGSFSSRRESATISQSDVVDFWNSLIWHMDNRRENRSRFDAIPENKLKILGELDKEFDATNPKILEQLGIIWNRILSKAGLKFDYENAKEPFRLVDNLHAYVTIIQDNQKIEYSQLSSGIRNFIFRLGHIFSLYFNRPISAGFLLVDEPENGLFPDFLYDLVDVYWQVTTDKNGENNTQMFFATHEPIIAGQFEPYERIILEWNDDGSVSAHRGVAPIFDDPNDILKKDFQVRYLSGESGNEIWLDFLEKKAKLKASTDPEEKDRLTREVLDTALRYNFKSA